ncbi:MAG: hypothetical protein DRO05_02815 [Thermoproteota archaeon]|nr:MAG: hypothetical protein DRO05_02815 [Candidatus Korarchaeota archaeon]
MSAVRGVLIFIMVIVLPISILLLSIEFICHSSSGTAISTGSSEEPSGTNYGSESSAKISQIRPSRKENARTENSSKRSFPDTTEGIFVFNDQLSEEMSEGQIKFAATHYFGSQKLVRSLTRKLREYNPNFIVLHYRLGIGLGYRRTLGDCEPAGDYIMIVEGDQWIQEWPEDVEESWFYHINGSRVLNCVWGWYLVDLDDEGWRSYWANEVLRQLKENENDGVFVDSFSVPNYLGPHCFNPPLPELDIEFEREWAKKLESFTEYMKGLLGDEYYWIPNVGAWITLRDPTNYLGADGVMIEGFSMWREGVYFYPEDWKLQMNRILNLSRKGKIIIAQTYVDGGVDARLFALGSYLLIKGKHTYINLETSLLPEWFPEYELPIGHPIDPLPENIDQFYVEEWGVYARRYSGGLVLVNPFQGSRHICLGSEKKYYIAYPCGGGVVPEDGKVPSSWRIKYYEVKQIDLPPHSAAILIYRPKA